MQIARIGDGLAIPLPADVAERLGLKEGDEITLRETESGALQVEVRAKPTVEELYERVRTMRGRLPADFKFDREWANSRGPDVDD